MSQVSDLRGAVLGKGYRLDRRLDDKDDHEYEGTHERIPGRFIVRLFPVETLLQAESPTRIQRGARVASLLRDPHAVQVLDFSASGDIPVFVVMERIPGRSLAAVMREDGMAPLPHAIELVASIAAGLIAGHQVGLVHGDLRPVHVILPTSGQPLTKVSGFGWAKELRAAARVPTPSKYLAPEQDFGKLLTLDERVDQFSLAALAYELIAGCAPFPEESADLAEKSGGRQPPPPPAIADMVPGVPSQIDEVLRRALSFVPSDRFGSVQELVSHLRDATPIGVSVPAPISIAQAPNTPTPTPIVGAPSIPTPPPILQPSAVPLPVLEALNIPTPHPIVGAHVGFGATPTVKSDTDITDELDLSSLAAVHADADGGIGDGGRRADDVDEDEDSQLVLGQASGPTTTDDAKTQIRRSPFLNDDPEVEEVAPRSPRHTPSSGRRGVPTGRPATLEGAHLSDSQRLTASPARPGLASARASLARFWNQFQKRRVWTFPAALGVVLVLIVAGIVRMSGEPDGVPMAPPPAGSNPTAKDRPPAVAAAISKQAASLAAGPQGAPTNPVLHEPTAPPSAPMAQAEPPSQAWPKVAPDTQPVPAAEPAPGPRGTVGIGRASSAPRGSLRRSTARRSNARTAVAAVDRSPAADPGKDKVSPPTGSPGDCSVHIVSKPWAQVWIDGKDTGLRTPVDNLKVPCGTRKLELKRPDKDIEQMEMLTVVAGKRFQGKYELQ